MGAIELTALRGSDPLGFLAALGVMRLCEENLDHPAELGWPDGPYRGAHLVISGVDDVEHLVEELTALASQTAAEERLIPGVEGFPPPKEGSGGSDPVRKLSISAGRGLATTANLQAANGNPQFAQWLHATVSTSVYSSPKKEALATTRLVVWPTGQTTFDRSLKKGRDAASDRDRMREALVRWKRVPGETAAYFDARAIRDAYVGQHLTGQMPNYGVPAAGWLALMALPLFPVRASSPWRAMTTAMQRPRGSSHTSLVWPVWADPRDLSAVRVLLEHSLVAEAISPRKEDLDAGLKALDLSAVFRSERRPGPQGGDGGLGRAQQTWPAREN